MTDPLPLGILLHESAGIVRSKEPVSVGLPVPKGRLTDQMQFVVTDPASNIEPCQSRILNRWPDNSVKWLQVDFHASVPAESTVCWQLLATSETVATDSRFNFSETDDMLTVGTGAGFFHLDKSVFRPFRLVSDADGNTFATGHSCCRLSRTDIGVSDPVIDEITVEERGPIRATVKIEGRFVGRNVTGLAFCCRLHFYSGSMQVRFAMTLHNQRAAEHSKGLWDLGDSGSFLFEGLTFHFQLPAAKQRQSICRPELGREEYIVAKRTDLTIYQESSGGDNWRSPNHRNAAGEIPISQCGYQIDTGGAEKVTGLRATPLLWSGIDDSGIAVAMPRFWQEFPKKISATEDDLQISLFPDCWPDLHELQGGEQKTHEFYMDFSSNQRSLSWAMNPLQAMASPETFHQAGVLRDLPGDNDPVDQFVTAVDVMKKREHVDEYGWRNFGEIYADHEAVGSTGDNIFVSHYNNQYDFIAGAYRKAFSCGDFGWLTIASDLARHVRDIDLYHTDRDREEYNHGLFWHTDHYADAGLSTHRSYSREQEGAYELHVGGGGPGPEHCYAGGLALHYFITGDPEFKDAVTSLAGWGLRALNGSQTILATLKRGMDSIRMLKNNGHEKQAFPVYPLTRGTGNVISACLEAFEVSGDQLWLQEIAEILLLTLSPEDDIDARRLDDPELAWSYTVLLSAIVKFLEKKQELDELDESFHHARHSLIHYAEWMAVNEYPYLDKPELLEYPNETWAAQELRKSVVLLGAARFTDNREKRELFIEKARFFHTYAEEELFRHGSSHLTRPVALMLQNGWVCSRMDTDAPGPWNDDSESRVSTHSTVPHLTLAAVLRRLVWDLGRAINKTSLRREINWLKLRIS